MNGRRRSRVRLARPGRCLAVAAIDEFIDTFLFLPMPLRRRVVHLLDQRARALLLGPLALHRSTMQFFDEIGRVFIHAASSLPGTIPKPRPCGCADCLVTLGGWSDLAG